MNKLKQIMLLGFTVTLTACNIGEVPTKEPTEVPKGTLSDSAMGAVLVTANWCQECAKMKSKVQSVRNSNTFEDTQFATIDFSSRNLESFYEKARELGVEFAFKDLMNENIKTGLVLIDIDDQIIYGNLQTSNSNQEIAKLIKHFEMVSGK